MRLRTATGQDLWLAYGMNVHPGGNVETLEAALVETVWPLRERLGADGPFGLALRFDADGVRELLEDDERRVLLRDLLAAGDFVPFTGNAFVVGDFHGRGTKAEVYRPTWREAARLEYTLAFAEVMSSLVGPGHLVSLSTSPLSFRRFREEEGFEDAAARMLADTARRLVSLEESTGTRVVLGLEPEPLCTLETTEEAIAFFLGPLRKALGRDVRASERLGVCWDVCHQAVEGEDPAAALEALAVARIPVVKVQASCALEVPDPSDPAARAALARFDEPRWLHQTIARRKDGSLRRAADLPEVLTGPDAAAWAAVGSPWRVHFHVPVHREALVPPLRTTRPALEAALVKVAQGGITSHLEIETYTWEGLPPDERPGDLVESLAREYEWVLSILAREGTVPAPEEDVPAEEGDR